jgi:hypothetical protein
MQDVQFFSGLAAVVGAGTQIGRCILLSNDSGTVVQVTGVTIAALAALTADDTNYVQLRLNLARRVGHGLSDAAEQARLTTQTTGGGGTGNWAPPTSEFFDFPLTAPIEVPNGWLLEAGFYTFGTGVDLPQIDFVVTSSPTTAPIFTE